MIGIYFGKIKEILNVLYSVFHKLNISDKNDMKILLKIGWIECYFCTKPLLK